MEISLRKGFLVHTYRRNLKEVQCPVCGGNIAYVLWETNSDASAQNYVLKERYPEKFLELRSHIESLWGGKTCEVVQCADCGFCYSNPYIAGDERFYSLAYGPSGYPAWKWELQLTYMELIDHFHPSSRLLEIGAGDGAFIRRIVGRVFPKENIFSTEFSEIGRARISKLGVMCISDDIRYMVDAAMLPEASVDVVCMFQVLEHMDGLQLLFKKINNLLKPGGSLFIAVPNPKRIEFNELNGALLDMPPNHIGRWNKKCFEVIGQQYGFDLTNYQIEISDFASMVKEFVYYRFLRNSQRSGSFENRVMTIQNRYLLRVMQVLGLLVNAIKAIPDLLKINYGLGTSIWVHLVKKRSFPVDF